MNKKTTDRCDDDQLKCLRYEETMQKKRKNARTNGNGEFPTNIDDDKSKWQLVIDLCLRMSINQLTCHNS